MVKCEQRIYPRSNPHLRGNSYSKKEYAIMNKAPCKTDIKVSRGAAVKDVVASAKALKFVNASGISFRLTFEGIHGWRLQSSKNGKFDDMGACQMLAQFMNEQMG